MRNVTGILGLVLVAAVASKCQPTGTGDVFETATVQPSETSSAVESIISGQGPCANDPRVGRVGFPGERPVVIQRVAPRTETLSADVIGIVVVEAIVDSDGAVCSAAVQKSLTPDADRMAVEAVKQWRFTPAQLDGEPWPVALNVTVKIR